MSKEKENVRESGDAQDIQNFPGYGYNPADGSYVNGNRTAVMPMMGSWPVPPVNPQWPVSTLDNMNVNPAICVNAATTMNVNTTVDINSGAAVGMNPYSYINPLAGSPNMYGMVNYGPYMYGSESSVVVPPVREIVRLSKCVLYPPNSNVQPPTREKPNGCKTIFVGGIPSNTTEEIIREVFQSFGEIVAVRLNNKKFCHVRFNNEEAVDEAIIYSGYRMKIDDKDDEPNTGRLHVDYAEARKDLRDYICQQRALQREARHRDKLEQEYLHPPTPPPIPHYSEHEAAEIVDKLKKEDAFLEGLSVLITWLERGECCKRNASTFYQMIKSTHSHVIFLKNEKVRYEEELQKAKMMLMQKSHSISLKFKEIDKVFHAASLQKVWDHFTRAQRKRIEDWRKETEDIEAAHVQEVVKERNEVDMEVDSDDEGDKPSKKAEINDSEASDQSESRMDLLAEIEALRRENTSLKVQLEATQNELALECSETKERELHQVQVHKVKQALQNAHKEFLTLSQKRGREVSDDGDSTPPAKKQNDDYDDEPDESDDEPAFVGSSSKLKKMPEMLPTGSAVTITESHARFIGLISTFLNVHPFGASIDYITSYINQIDSMILARDIESVMKQFPTVFKEECTGIGASLEKKWTFCGFQPHVA